jgi:5'-methylthioadenosine phosphorylase
MGKIGIIGGSGMYKIDGVKITETRKVDTPFGDPSDEYALGELAGREVVFLPRHGKGHLMSPSCINYRANIFGMKKLGVDRLISVSACGSLKKEIKPLDFVIPMQFVDRTNQARGNTFFDEGVVAHVGFARPVCMDLAYLVHGVTKHLKIPARLGGIYLNMEGPQFSTRAESNLYRMWGMDIIGMTNMVEARLAREAEICYVTLAAVTDYDCWYDGEAASVDTILDNLMKNVENAKQILKSVVTEMEDVRRCECKDALKHALITDPQMIPPDVKKRLDVIIGKYVR